MKFNEEDIVICNHHKLGKIKGAVRYPDQLDWEQLDPSWMPPDSAGKVLVIVQTFSPSSYEGDVWSTEDRCQLVSSSKF